MMHPKGVKSQGKGLRIYYRKEFAMRKAFVLTSILALAACSGGGGEHNPGYAHGPAGTPTVSNAATFTSGIYTNTETNNSVTQMKTQVVVDSGGRVIVPNLARSGHIRSGSIQDINGNTYHVYDLEDVQLNVADEVPASLKIGLADDGAIKDITLSSGNVESKLARDGDTNQFRGPIFEYVKDGKDKAEFRVVDTGQSMDDLIALESPNSLTGGHWNYVDERMDVTTNKHITAGNENAPVLQYSDFGHFNPVYRTKHTELNADVLADIRAYGADIEAALLAGDDAALAALKDAHPNLDRGDKDKYRSNAEFAAKLAEATYQLFAGGYAIGADGQPIAGGSFIPPVSATFTGTGVGRVYASISNKENGTEKEYRAAVLDQYNIDHDNTDDSINNAGHNITKSLTTSSATLTVDASGNQQLVMNFPDFYRVTATKTAGGAEDVVLDNPNNIGIAEQYKKNSDIDALPTYTTEQYQVTDNGTIDTAKMFMPGYYGVGSASEAAGLVRYAEERDGITVKDMTDPDNPEKVHTFKREFEFQGAYGMSKD